MPAQCSCRNRGHQTQHSIHSIHSMRLSKHTSNICWQDWCHDAGLPSPGLWRSDSCPDMLAAGVQVALAPPTRAAVPPASKPLQCGSVGWRQLLPSGYQQAHTLHAHPQPPNLAIIIHHLARRGHTTERKTGRHAAGRQGASSQALGSTLSLTPLALAMSLAEAALEHARGLHGMCRSKACQQCLLHKLPWCACLLRQCRQVASVLPPGCQ